MKYEQRSCLSYPISILEVQLFGSVYYSFTFRLIDLPLLPKLVIQSNYQSNVEHSATKDTSHAIYEMDFAKFKALFLA